MTMDEQVLGDQSIFIMTNVTNGTSNNETDAAYAYWYQWMAQASGVISMINNVYVILKLAKLIVPPICVFIGIPLTLFTFFNMLFTKLSVAKKAFYAYLTFVWLLLLIFTYLFQNLAWVEVYLGLRVSGDHNQFYFVLYQYSFIACLFETWVVLTASSTLAYLILFQLIKRYFLLKLPDCHLPIKISQKASLTALSAIFVICAITNLHVFYVYVQVDQFVCVSPMQSFLLLVSIYFIDYVLPNFLLAIMLLFTIKAATRKSCYLSRNNRGRTIAESERRGRKAAIVIILIALMHCLLYTPASILKFLAFFNFGFSWMIFNSFFQLNLHYFFLELTGLLPIIYFFVYIRKVPEFSANLKLLCCFSKQFKQIIASRDD